MVAAALEAEKSGWKLMACYPSEGQVKISQGLAKMEDFDDDVPLGEEVEMFQELRTYLNEMKTTRISEWEDKDKKRSVIVFTKVAAHVVKKCQNNCLDE